MAPPVILDKLRQLVRGELPWPFFVYGSPGTGKTCAGLCLCDHAKDAEFFKLPEFYGLVNQAKQGDWTWPGATSGSRGYESDFWRWIESRSLVVLDEIGLRDRVSDPMYEAVQLLLDKREGRPLMVTSNLGLDKIVEIFDARMLDRLSCGTVLQIQGDSMRQT